MPAQWLYGWHPVREALRARRRRLLRLLLCERPSPREAKALEALAREARVPVEWAPEPRLAEAVPAGARHQGVVLEAEALPGIPLVELLGAAGAGILVALDEVHDPQNLGAILRSVDGSGARGVILPERRAAPLSPAVARASAGASEHVLVSRVGNLAHSLDEARERGFWIAGLGLAGSTADLYDVPDRLVTGSLVLVLGSEGKGLRPGIEKRLDHHWRIPMAGEIESLNVAAAGAVALFELARRRRAPV